MSMDFEGYSAMFGDEDLGGFHDTLKGGSFREAFGEWMCVPPGKCVLCLAGDARPGSGVCAACANRSG